MGFYSATDLQKYWAESNQTFYNERIYIEVVHLGICFVVRPKLGSYDSVKNEKFQHGFALLTNVCLNCFDARFSIDNTLNFGLFVQTASVQMISSMGIFVQCPIIN